MLIPSDYPYFPFVSGISYLDQTYTTYWKNIMSLPFFCFLFISAISYFTLKNLTNDLSTYFSQYYVHTTKLHIVRTQLLVKPPCLLLCRRKLREIGGQGRNLIELSWMLVHDLSFRL
jgi:hypothetical protein